MPPASKPKAKKAPVKKASKSAAKKKAAPKTNNAVAKIKKSTASVSTRTTPNAMEETMSKSTQQFDQFTAQASEAGRESMEAFMKFGNIWMKGCEDIMQTATAISQSAAEKQSQYIKEALSAKTLNEWAETQNKIAQASFDDFMQGATKITEMSVKVLTEATEPLNSQMTKAMHQASKAAA